MDQQEEDASVVAFVGICESIKLLVTMLSSISTGRKDQRVRCEADEHGLLVTYQSKGKSLQLKTSVARQLFDSFVFHGEAATCVSFSLDLSLLLDCLHMFGASALNSTSLRIVYNVTSASLLLQLEETGVLCECALQVFEPDTNDLDALEFETAFERSVVVGRCIMLSESLHDAFAELYDLPSAATVRIEMFPTNPKNNRAIGASQIYSQSQSQSQSQSAPNRPCSLRLSANSESGCCEIDFARDSTAFIEFSCVDDDRNSDSNTSSDSNGCGANFHVAVLQLALKALPNAKESFLRLNADGFLSIQHLIQSETGEKAFVDVLVSPEESMID